MKAELSTAWRALVCTVPEHMLQQQATEARDTTRQQSHRQDAKHCRWWQQHLGGGGGGDFLGGGGGGDFFRGGGGGDFFFGGGGGGGFLGALVLLAGVVVFFFFLFASSVAANPLQCFLSVTLPFAPAIQTVQPYCASVLWSNMSCSPATLLPQQSSADHCSAHLDRQVGLLTKSCACICDYSSCMPVSRCQTWQQSFRCKAT